MNEEKQPMPARTALSIRKAAIYAVLLLVVFLVGFGIVYLVLQVRGSRFVNAPAVFLRQRIL